MRRKNYRASGDECQKQRGGHGAEQLRGQVDGGAAEGDASADEHAERDDRVACPPDASLATATAAASASACAIATATRPPGVPVSLYSFPAKSGDARSPSLVLLQSPNQGELEPRARGENVKRQG
ncbi:hypothetical protein PVAP13_7NG335424 [Panicum virgatum]|uniref:Uncharacterized protein n=1 Tax=Panicum virgatum TaxID=38727 RepID=A0A8T0Q2M6_PANVG|nr:hypothetical protein PVAP13_7NG335424 [Panicum virgatum]